MSFDLCKEIRGSMTEFQKLTPELVEKLCSDGLTYTELKEELDKAGLSIDNVVCDTSRVFQNAFYADYENGKYCEMYLQREYLDKLIQVATLNFSYQGKNPLLISKDWKQYYFHLDYGMINSWNMCFHMLPNARYLFLMMTVMLPSIVE